MVHQEFSRRDVLRRAAYAGAGLLAASAGTSLLAACGNSAPSDKPTSSGGVGQGPFRMQVAWVPMGMWAGEYIAVEQQLFQKAGLESVELLHGGPQMTPEPLVVAGKVDMSMTICARFAASVMNGAPLVAIAMDYQRGSYCVTSLPGKPILKPEDLRGKRIGVQAVSEGVWGAFLKINGIDPASITKVPVQTDPSLLTSGQVDGHLGFVNNTPVTLRNQGLQPIVMNLSDHGFTLLEQPFIVTRDALKNRRPRVLAGLKAELAARTVLSSNPQLGIDLTVNKYAAGTGITAKLAEGQITESLKLEESDLTRQKGIGHISEEGAAATIETLAAAGIKIDKSAFDTSLLDEIYADGPIIKF